MTIAMFNPSEITSLIVIDAPVKQAMKRQGILCISATDAATGIFECAHTNGTFSRHIWEGHELTILDGFKHSFSNGIGAVGAANNERIQGARNRVIVDDFSECYNDMRKIHDYQKRQFTHDDGDSVTMPPAKKPQALAA